MAGSGHSVPEFVREMPSVRSDASLEKTIEQLFRAIEVFREGRDRCSVLHVAMFLLIASRSPISPSDMKAPLGLSMSSVSTALARLIDYSRSGHEAEPLGLITLDRHPRDTRTKLAFLTPAGRELVERMCAALGMQDGDDKTSVDQ